MKIISFIKNLIKSPGFDVNAAIIAAIGLLKAFGIDLPEGVSKGDIAVVISAVNIVVRLFTKKALF